MEKWVALMIFSLALATTFLGCGTNSSGNTETVNRGNFSNTYVGSNNILQVENHGGTEHSTNTNAANSHTTGGDFWTEAATGGMAEVEMGRLAATKAQNPEVKNFGQMMVTDHTKANDELKSVAQQKHVTLPGTLDAKHMADATKLQAMSGAEFDKQYVEMMVADHEKTVALFERAQNGPDAEAKAFAAKNLPVIQKHLETIKTIQGKLH